MTGSGKLLNVTVLQVRGNADPKLGVHGGLSQGGQGLPSLDSVYSKPDVVVIISGGIGVPVISLGRFYLL